MFFVTENDFWIMFMVFMIALVGFGLSVVTSRRYIKARLFELFLGHKRVLRMDKDGKCRWYNQKADCGFLLHSDSHTQIAMNKIVRTEEGDFFIQTEGFGLTYDLEVASAVSFLTRLGFRDLVQALNSFDAMYFDKPENKARLDEAIKEDNKNQNNIHVKRIMKDARSELLTLEIEWVNDWTVPLAVTYRWALQNIDSMNNKNIFDKGVLKAMKDNTNQGWTQEKTMFMVMALAGLIIVAAIAFYIFSLVGMNQPHAVQQTINAVTTTTLK